MWRQGTAEAPGKFFSAQRSSRLLPPFQAICLDLRLLAVPSLVRSGGETGTRFSGIAGRQGLAWSFLAAAIRSLSQRRHDARRRWRESAVPMVDTRSRPPEPMKDRGSSSTGSLES